MWVDRAVDVRRLHSGAVDVRRFPFGEVDVRILPSDEPISVEV